ncbi:MAG: hypothetical protein JWR32_2223 [Mycobacterium sp.]|jgi:hypothetical protein|nr:hypothetical protein [Mycobacterium sp.]
MSNRDLAAAAAIVWGIAVLVGVFITAPQLLGLDVNIGLIVNALVAIGAFAAAAAAVWVATTDRQVRKKERDAEDDAAAKLVIVLPRRPQNPLELQIQVTNHGPRAIVDVTFVGLVVEGHDLQPTLGPFPVIPTPGNFSLFTFRPESYGQTHPYYIAVRGGPNNEPQTITARTRMKATIRWTDASGKTWERWGSGPADASRVDLGTPVRIGA